MEWLDRSRNECQGCVLRYSLRMCRRGAAPGKMYSCELCTYWTYSWSEFHEHEEEHPSCHTCQRMFVDLHSRRQHFLASSFHNYCGICERDFQSSAALKGHQETHRPRDIKCPQCGRGFTSASAMAKHVRRYTLNLVIPLLLLLVNLIFVNALYAVVVFTICVIWLFFMVGSVLCNWKWESVMHW